MKSTQRAVALVIKDKNDNILVVKRSDDPKDSLAGVWGFPAVSLKENEKSSQAAIRVGSAKLGVDVSIVKKIGSSTSERDKYILNLTDYEAKIISGIPIVPQSDTSLSQYVDWKFTSDSSILFEAARRGSLCSQIYLRHIGSDWKL